MGATRERCAALWGRMLTRELRVLHVESELERNTMILREHAVGAPEPSARDRAVLERALLGESRKSLGAAFGLSSPTLAKLLKRTLAGMGLDCSPALVPEPLVLLVHASLGWTDPALVRLSGWLDARSSLSIVACAPLTEISPLLSPAESAVLRERMAGSSYADIARRRNRSPRTIANQIAAASQRLGVSGRLEILHALLTSATHAPTDVWAAQ